MTTDKPKNRRGAVAGITLVIGTGTMAMLLQWGIPIVKAFAADHAQVCASAKYLEEEVKPAVKKVERQEIILENMEKQLNSIDRKLDYMSRKLPARPGGGDE